MIGVFGGTFNPIHNGHIQTAVEIKALLGLREVRLVPCALPPHRDTPSVAAQVRLQMVRAAVKGHPDLIADDSEVNREGVSYTYDTLAQLREHYAVQTLCLIVGMDAFLHFDTWRRWKDIFNLAHVVVVHRPGWSDEMIVQAVSCELKTYYSSRKTQDVKKLHQQPAGLIFLAHTTPVDLSSSAIRRRVAEGKSLTGLVPNAIDAIIRTQKLYQY